jgi:hypothetical protein
MIFFTLELFFNTIIPLLALAGAVIKGLELFIRDRKDKIFLRSGKGAQVMDILLLEGRDIRFGKNSSIPPNKSFLGRRLFCRTWILLRASFLSLLLPGKIL